MAYSHTKFPLFPILTILLLIPQNVLGTIETPQTANIFAKTQLLGTNQNAHFSVNISQKGLTFAKNILITHAVAKLTPMDLPKIHKSIRLPVIGNVYVVLSGIRISSINVSSELSSVEVNEEGIEVLVKGATASLGLEWRYEYSSWVFVPVTVSDKGHAAVKVEGMEVELTLGLVNEGGTLKLSLVESRCNVSDISIILEGGASWFYQGFVEAFEEQIKSVVETTIVKKIKEEIPTLNSLLQTLPKEISIDDVAFMNVTIVNELLLCDNSIDIEINGLFTTSNVLVVPKRYIESRQASASSKDSSKMLKISIDEDVLNSGSIVLFDADLMHLVVDKVPDQSLLNTAGWKFVVPQLYKTYPNDDMMLNVSLSSPPIIRISSNQVGATIDLDMTIEVLDGNQIIEVACISVVVRVSGYAIISGNNLAGSVNLDDFTLSLKWSRIGKLHVSLIQSMIWTVLKTVVLPNVNSHLRKGFPLPIIDGFTLQNADIIYTDSRIVISSDVVLTQSYNKQLPVYQF